MPDFWFIEPEGAVVRAKRSWRNKDGTAHPASAFDLWSQDELRSQGVYPGRYDPATPRGRFEIASESAPRIVDGEAVITRTYTELPEPVPQAVTRLQLVRALRHLGRKQAFDAAMAAAPAEVREDWNLTVTVERTSPLLATPPQSISVRISSGW